VLGNSWEKSGWVEKHRMIINKERIIGLLDK